jgi:hypothetical protein
MAGGRIGGKAGQLGRATIPIMRPPEPRCTADREAGALCVYSDDLAPLEDLAARLREVATEEARLRQLVDLAAANGFEFDD